MKNFSFFYEAENSRTILKSFLLFLVFSFIASVECQPLDALPRNSAVITRYPESLPSLPPEKKVVLIGGVFDIFHYGHLVFFEAAKEQGDYLVVALEPDVFIEKHKHRKPVHTQKQRAEILAHLNMVDEVVMLPSLQGYKEYLELVKKIHPDIIAITEGDPHQAEKEKQAAQIGAKVIPVTGRNSSFSTRQILKHTCK